MIDTLFNSIDRFRAMRVRQMSQYWQASADIPATLYPYWKRTAHFEFKGIPQDAFFFARASEGLLSFFDCVSTSGKPCALPSAAADSVWHAWLRLAPASLEAFCVKHFGRTIAHVEDAQMDAPMDHALANCMAAAIRLRGQESGLPLLFGLDGKVKMPGGFGYQLVQGQVGCRRLDAQGRPEGALFYPMGLAAVPGLGQRASAAKGDGAGCGAGCSGGCDGGGSCGSGCGGD